jgi:hypothetical protein
MKHFVLRGLLPLWSVGAVLMAQNSTPQIGKIAFEVASIKPAPRQPMGQGRTGMSTDPGMVRYDNVSLRDCIRTAYRIKDVQGGPGLDR